MKFGRSKAESGRLARSVRASRADTISHRARRPMTAAGTAALLCVLAATSASAINLAAESNREAIRVRSRFFVPIFVTADGTEMPNAAIDGMRAVVKSPEDVLVVARIRNTGNIVLRCPVAFAIESQGDEIATAEK